MTNFIVEIGSNHNGDFGRACALVDLAAEVGAEAVKVQLWRVTTLFAQEALAHDVRLAKRADLELPVLWLDPLAQRAHSNGLRFGVSVFDARGVEVALKSAPIDFLKVASYSLTYEPLLDLIGRTRIAVIASTGMASQRELVVAWRHLKLTDLTWLHCVSSYPVRVEDCNLGRIEALERMFGVPVGWSDHSTSPAVILRAAHRYGAPTIECHLDLDGKGAEAIDGHCWLPGQLQDVIQLVRAGEAADGPGEISPRTCELPERAWRADPDDGLRPMQSLRAQWTGKAVLPVEN